MAGEKTARELIYETNRDVKWICKMLQRMEARDEDFEGRLRALEGWRADAAGEERRVSTVGAGAGGVAGGESYPDADKGRQHIHNPHSIANRSHSESVSIFSCFAEHYRIFLNAKPAVFYRIRGVTLRQDKR